MSITAIPILGRIFLELGLSHTRTATLTIGAAAIDDICGWLLLGVVAAIVTSGFEAVPFVLRVAALLAYGAFVLVILRPVIDRMLSRQLARRGHITGRGISYMLILLLCSAAITSNLGVFAIFGGFLIGLALHENRQFTKEWNKRVGGFVGSFFLPMFFAYTGLRTDIGSLGSFDLWLQCAAVILIAFVGKFGGAYIAARMVGESRRSAMTIGICMNTRALMELIALNIGYDLGILSPEMFTMLVIMAIFSTFIATPAIRWLMIGPGQRPPAAAAQTGLITLIGRLRLRSTR